MTSHLKPTVLCKEPFFLSDRFTFSFIFSFLRVVSLCFFNRRIPWCSENVSDIFNVYWKWFFTILESFEVKISWKKWKKSYFSSCSKIGFEEFLSDKFTFSVIFSFLRVVRLWFFTDAFLDVRRVFQILSICIENEFSQFWSRLKWKRKFIA